MTISRGRKAIPVRPDSTAEFRLVEVELTSFEEACPVLSWRTTTQAPEDVQVTYGATANGKNFLIRRTNAVVEQLSYFDGEQNHYIPEDKVYSYVVQNDSDLITVEIPKEIVPEFEGAWKADLSVNSQRINMCEYPEIQAVPATWLH